MTAEPIYLSTLQRMTADELRAKLEGGSEEAARWIYAAAVHGYTQAQVMWGQMLLDGHGVQADPPAAFRWFNIAALAEDLDGINLVGRCYELGWGVAIDAREAARWFRKAADKGHAWAQFNLATLILNGRGVAQDVPVAMSLLVRSARQGNPKAMNMIGRCRELGWHGRADLPSAVRWYRRAAQGGCFRGSFHLARFLASRGDIEQAARWFKCSVDHAPADFCRDVADVLLGQHESAFRDIGRHALRRAAESDVAADVYAYGLALATGRGGPVDLAQARIWLARAKAQNFPGAASALDDVMTHLHAPTARGKGVETSPWA